MPAYKRELNTVFQKYALFPHMNVYDNIAFGLKIKKMSKDVIDQKVMKMLKLIGLEGFENKDYRHSIIEDFMEYEEEIIRKIFAIERVFDRLQGDMKEIIRQKYLLPGNTVEEICNKLNIPQATYFRLQYDALLCFARALGYIK